MPHVRGVMLLKDVTFFVDASFDTSSVRCESRSGKYSCFLPATIRGDSCLAPCTRSALLRGDARKQFYGASTAAILQFNTSQRKLGVIIPTRSYHVSLLPRVISGCSPFAAVCRIPTIMIVVLLYTGQCCLYCTTTAVQQ